LVGSTVSSDMSACRASGACARKSLRSAHGLVRRELRRVFEERLRAICVGDVEATVGVLGRLSLVGYCGTRLSAFSWLRSSTNARSLLLQGLGLSLELFQVAAQSEWSASGVAQSAANKLKVEEGGEESWRCFFLLGHGYGSQSSTVTPTRPRQQRPGDGATGQRDRPRSDITFSRQHRVATLLLVRAPCDVVHGPERNG